MSSDNIVPFQFESHNIRVYVDEHGEPWWVLTDVCEALGLKNPSKVSSRLKANEITDLTSSYIDNPKPPKIVNEKGLYRVIMRSDKPEAERFQEWVFGEVLPAIRKTGSYSINKPVVKNLDRQASIHAPMRVDALEQQQQVLEQKNEELEQRVTLLETAQHPPAGKYTTQGFAAAFNKPRIDKMRWKRFNQLCWRREHPEPFVLPGGFTRNYYSVETLEWAFQEAFFGEKNHERSHSSTPGRCAWRSN